MAVGVGKVDPASAVVMIDLTRAATPRIGPVLDALLLDATEDSIEIGLGNQECVVLRLDGSIGTREIQRRRSSSAGIPLLVCLEVRLRHSRHVQLQ